METVDLRTVKSFKYIRSTTDRKGGCSKDVESIVAKAWSIWRDLIGVICDNENEGPDILNSDSTDVALRLRNMANVG